jgi:hypothetical protein
MSRNKTPPPPLVDVRSDYEAALAAVHQAANMLAIGVDTVLKIPDQVKPRAAAELRELVAKFNAAYFGDKS